MTNVAHAPNGLPSGSRLWWGLPVLLGILWVAGLTSVVSYPGLPSPPDATYWLLPATRYARDIAAALTVGAVVVGALLVPGRSARALGWAIRWAAAWLALVVLGLVLTRSEVEALSPLDALSPDSLLPLLVDETVGRVFLGQFVALVAVMGLAWALTAMPVRGGLAPSARAALSWVCALLAVSAAAAPAFVGHAGLHDSHVAATVSLLIHIAAVSLWVGGLVVVVALSRVEPDTAMAVLPRFSIMALWCVILIAETGLLNASLRLTLPSEFVGTLYGSLIIGKAVLLGWLVGLGYRQRRQVLQRQAVAGQPAVPGLLGRYAASEFMIMGVAVALSIALARIGPAPAEAATGGYSPVALAILGIALPMLIVHVRTQCNVRPPASPSSRLMPWLRAHSEVAAVTLLVVVADVAGLQALNGLLGDQLGTIVGVMAIVCAGWLWAECLDSRQGLAGIAVVMAGWPVVVWVNGFGQALGAQASVRIAIATVIAVEVLLAARLVSVRLARARVARARAANEVAGPGAMTGAALIDGDSRADSAGTTALEASLPPDGVAATHGRL